MFRKTEFSTRGPIALQQFRDTKRPLELAQILIHNVLQLTSMETRRFSFLIVMSRN